ncbi:type II secretion system protein [Candidatus Curtissbacteria bacterium]|nr:type II secretion system protein [Candidatus Curtissbacteria bacterium]
MSHQISAGFTLIELLIVIAILGILAAAVLIAVNPGKRQNQAKDANIKNDIGSIATALQAYYTAPGSGSYPDVDAPDSGLQKLVSNEDLKQEPLHPDGTNYVYNVTPGTCAGTVLAPCTEAYLYGDLYDDSTNTLVWCWESVEGRAEAETIAQCTDFSATT